MELLRSGRNTLAGPGLGENTVKQHRVNLDAIVEGMLVHLRAKAHQYETRNPPRLEFHKAPPKTHAVLWEDDWWRGATLSQVCQDRAFQEFPKMSQGDRAQVLRIAAQFRKGPTKKIKGLGQDQRDALELLRALLDNVVCGGDPEYTMRRLEPDLEEDAEERDPA